ncbi:MAG: lysylphosphatidylglycerol synthase domain-containing protein [Gammaproteobacteria bacterium]|nr:lysylphosphatidylglycerol synthase domain-containing protein [Gammaproteobacteria bacterium]
MTVGITGLPVPVRIRRAGDRRDRQHGRRRARRLRCPVAGDERLPHWRYLVMLRLSGFRPGRAALFPVVVVRNFFSDMLPARIGTLVYVYLVTNRLGIPFGAAASSFALAFVFDILALAPLLLAAIVLAGAAGSLDPVVLAAAAALLFGISVGVLMALPMLARTAARATRATDRAARAAALLLVACLRRHLRGSRADSTSRGLRAPARPIAAGTAGQVRLALHAPVCHGRTAGLRLRRPAAAGGIAGPGRAGTRRQPADIGSRRLRRLRGAWALVFGLLVFPQELAALTAISHHVFTQVYGALLGLAALLVLMLPFVRWSPESTTGG